MHITVMLNIVFYAGVSDLLELVGKEVLRKQPKNVIEFVANLLTRMVRMVSDSSIGLVLLLFRKYELKPKIENH